MAIDAFHCRADWNSQQLQESHWRQTLSQQHIDEIHTAIAACQDKPLDTLTRGDFVLPTLGPLLHHLAQHELEQGLGAVLLQGLPTADYNDTTNKLLIWGLGLYLGHPVSQSIYGEMIYEVKDEGYHIDHPKARGPNINSKLNFHNDMCDIASLLCVRQAAKGGESQLVSSVAIHNKMAQDCPELLVCLYEPYHYKRHNVDLTSAQGTYQQPIFAVEQGHFICNILRRLIDLAQDLPDVPKMTSQQIRALDVFHELAHDPELCHTYTMHDGDLLLLNSFVTLHSRLAFEDGANPEKNRLMLRLWLWSEYSRPLPHWFGATYHQTAAGQARGGIYKKA